MQPLLRVTCDMVATSLESTQCFSQCIATGAYCIINAINTIYELYCGWEATRH